MAARTFLPGPIVTGVKDQINMSRTCTITASSTLPSAISLPVQVAPNIQHFPTNISVPSSIAMPFVSHMAQKGKDEPRIAPPTSHAPIVTHHKRELKANISGIPLRATQAVPVVATSVPATAKSSATTALLQTSSIATQLQNTSSLIPMRSTSGTKSSLQSIQDLNRQVYSQALKVSTTPPPSAIDSRTESKLAAKIQIKSEPKLDDSKVSGKGDATPKLNWPIQTSKSFSTKHNVFGVARGIVSSTAIPITYISKPVSARSNITNSSSSHVVVGQPATCTGGINTTTSVPIPIGVASKILQQAPVPRQHGGFPPDSQPIFLAGPRQPVSAVHGAVPGGHPRVTIPPQYPYYLYPGDGSFPRYQPPMSSYVGHSFTPITNAGVRQQLNVNPQISLQPTSNTGAAATVAAVARAATVAGGPVRLGPLVADLRTAGSPYTIPPLTSTEGDVVTGGMFAGNVSSPSNQTLPNPGSSPRPSILRKRHNDGNIASVRKPLFQNPSGAEPASPSSKVEIQRQTTSPKQSESLSSSQQSIESSVSETNNAQSMLIKIKQEKKENDVPSMLSSLQDSLHLPERNEEPSPRKRQRKQQHKIASQQMLDDKSTDDETETKKDTTPTKKEKKQRKMKLVQYIKRSSLKLLDSYHQTWKPTHNHFQRYSDVKAKEEKRTGIHEIANQRGIIKKTDGWKIKHVGHQLTDMIDQEQEVYDEMQAIKAGMGRQLTENIEGSVIDKSLIETETNRIYELIQGNIQRSKYVLEHIEETKTIMGRLLDHKPKVVSIIKKHANKRHAKKKHAT
ncbi:uncharacterized protein [Antedon mediterranea]|uniref:uncharacterized protein n=1 Tax=Antedon mediterranea TaxID=105859 RepID=UPI003AF7C322